MYIFLELTLGQNSLPSPAFLFRDLQVVALESLFAHLVSD